MTSPITITPDWPAPPTVAAISTTRNAGVSEGAYTNFNIGAHCGDNPDHVACNRKALREQCGFPTEPSWLKQVHGDHVVALHQDKALLDRTADASYTTDTNTVCVVMTADCLPILFCDKQGTCVASVHAGWRSLAAGIIEKTIAALPASPDDLLAWFGPAIGADAFEIGDEVKAQLSIPDSDHCFTHNAAGRWFCSLTGLASLRCQRVGVTALYGGEHCTYREKDRFYSYRRDGQTGRLGSFIWLKSS